MTARILLADTSNPPQQSMRAMLDESELDVEVVEVADGKEALRMALSGEIDVVVSDVQGRRLDGISMLRTIRQTPHAAALPVILVAEQLSADARETSFEVGASDYISRPFSSSELVARLSVQLRLRSLEKELQRAGDHYRRLSSVDELTGLANRRRFLDACHRELARSRRHELALSVCVADVDRLKRINERSGCRAGDAIISDVAAVIQRQLRTADLLARIAGGTFAMLLPHTNAEQAGSAAGRVRAAVRAQAFLVQNAGEVTVSLGVATYPSGHLDSSEELVNAAQASLDRAKTFGGNRVEVHNPVNAER
jgi:diguanylate cyclase (GGDEF)-like protein